MNVSTIQGKSGKYTEYIDPRTWNIPNASWFVETADILGKFCLGRVVKSVLLTASYLFHSGISVIAEEFMCDPNQVKLLKSRGQVNMKNLSVQSVEASLSEYFDGHQKPPVE